MILSIHARINSSRYIRRSRESDDDNRYGHAAIFEVKFVKTSVRAVKESRERSSEQLFADLELVASAVEGSDLGPTRDPLSLQQVATMTPKETTGNQIWSVQTEMLCVPSPPR